MNERIRELYYECCDESLTTEQSYQKFAELIVRECADVADNPDVDMLRIGKAIKEHFGVEE